jgi:hypothetical protein
MKAKLNDAMLDLDQSLGLPQQKIGIRFTPISRHYARKMAAVLLP